MNCRLVVRYFVLVVLALVLCLGANAQNENVTIVDDYKANIQDADKANVKPVGWDTIVNKEVMSYDFLSRPSFRSYSIKPFSPIEPMPQTQGRLKNNYLRLGLGNYLNFDAEAYIYQPVSKSTGIGLEFEHFSSAGGIKNYAPNGFSRDYVDLYVKSAFGNTTIKFDVNYNHDLVHYYGFNPVDYTDAGDWVLNDKILKDTIKQRFQNFGTKFSIMSNGKSKLNYRVDAGYNYMFDRFKTSEGRGDLSVDLNSDVKWFAGSQNIGATLSTTLFHNSVEPMYESGGGVFASHYAPAFSTLTTISPYFNIEYEMLRFKLGFDLGFSTDTIARFYAHPQIELGFVPIKNMLYVYLGARGGVNRNGLHEMAAQNKFVNTQMLDYRFANTLVDGYAGLTVSFAKYFEINVEGGYSVNTNMNFFVNDPTAFFDNKFINIYDDGGVAYGKAYIKFNMNDKYKAEAGANYSYQVFKNEIKTWQSPNLYVYGKTDVKLYRGLRANALVYIVGSTAAKGYVDYTGRVYPDKYLPAYCDINVGLTYKLNGWLSFFGDLNNILGNKYQYWNNYRSQSFNFMLGAGFSF